MLNDLNLLGAADELMIRDEDLHGAGTVEVVGAVEIVEVVQG